jgi:MoaA/NifB/PqqE/SkfB family radical SAM enzyme
MNPMLTVDVSAAEAPCKVDPHHISSLPVLVLFPHNRCNCRCVMCDIWRIKQVREITAEDLAPHLDSLRRLKVQWIVLSGGEPQLHSNLKGLCGLLRAEGIRLTLLTAGLRLEAQARLVVQCVDDLIVSLDGPPEIHDRIRGVPRAFERLAGGIKAVRMLRPSMPVRARSTVQKANFRHLRATAHVAKDLGLDSISFLAADVTSSAFNRPQGWATGRQASVSLTSEEVNALEAEIDALISECSADFISGFMLEDEVKLRRIVRHFRAQLGQLPLNSPQCNAPWVSAVVESDGTVRPCFFHPGYGSIRDRTLLEVLNSPGAASFRRKLDIATNPVCQRCVCSLSMPQKGEISPAGRVG